MKGSQIQRLARVADLARLEFGSPSITLGSVDTAGTVYAAFRGAYAVGYAVEPATLPPFLCTVDGEQFKAIMELFGPDEEITLKPNTNASSLQIAAPASGKAANLRTSQANEPWDYNPESIGVSFGFTVDGPAFLDEMETASLFLSDPKRGMHILTGARLEVRDSDDGKGELYVSTSNGVSAVYTSVIPLSGIGAAGGVEHPAAAGVAIVSPKDVAFGLKFLQFDSGHVLVQYNEQRSRLTVSDQNGNLFYATGLAGEWPALESIIHPLGEVSTVSIVSTSLKNVSTASTALKAGSDIELAGSKSGGIIVRTAQTVDGAFALRDGKQDQKVAGVRLFNGETMATVAKLADTLDVSIPTDPKKPTEICAGARRIYLISKYSSQ